MAALVELPCDVHGNGQPDNNSCNIAQHGFFNHTVHKANQPCDHDIVDLPPELQGALCQKEAGELEEFFQQCCTEKISQDIPFEAG